MAVEEEGMKSKILILSLVIGLGVTPGCRSSDNPTDSTNARNENGAAPASEAPASEPAPPDTANSKSVGNAANGGHYKIDSGRSTITAQVGVGGLLSSLGHPHTVSIRGVTGEIQVTPDKIEPASFKISAKANTAAEVSKEFNEQDRQKVNEAMRGEALEAAKFPDIVLKSTAISVTKTGEGRYRAQVQADLTLHGVTRRVQIAAQITLTGTSLNARGQFQIRHSDYQIKRISAGGGTVKAKEEIALSFNISANGG
jgi:polyisoprenoid-binding protein YceI